MTNYLIGFFLLLTPTLTFAQVFPKDAITVHVETSTTSGIIIPNSSATPITVLYTLITSETNLIDTKITASGTTIFGNSRISGVTQFLNYVTTSTILFDHVGGGSAFYAVTYVPYNRRAATSTEQYIFDNSPDEATIASTTVQVDDTQQQYTVVVLLVIAALLAFDFARRLFGKMIA